MCSQTNAPKQEVIRAMQVTQAPQVGQEVETDPEKRQENCSNYHITI